jgi:ribosome-binding protein aMBF1 (putative translation factor)
MSEVERQLLDARTQMAAAVREARAISNLSRKELRKRLKTSQPRIAKIERAAPDVSLDQLVRTLVAAGG